MCHEGVPLAEQTLGQLSLARAGRAVQHQGFVALVLQVILSFPLLDRGGQGLEGPPASCQAEPRLLPRLGSLFFRLGEPHGLDIRFPPTQAELVEQVTV